MNTQDYIRLENEYGARNYRPLDVVLARGEGIWVWDVEGKRYMDFLSAYSAVNQGHCHQKIAAAMVQQARRLTLTSRAFRNDQLGLFYQELCELTHSHMVLPMNSGAEAVESCIKAVRKWGYREKGIPDGEAEIICGEHDPRKTLRTRSRLFIYKKADPEGKAWVRHCLDRIFEHHDGTKIIDLGHGRKGIISIGWAERRYVHLWEPY